MSKYRFSSCLAAQMERFVNLRRLSGTDYHSQTQLLGYFDRFLVQQGFDRPYITREITDLYQQGLTTLAPCTQGNRMSVLRQFCEYLTVNNPQSYVPRKLKKTDHTAYADLTSTTYDSCWHCYQLLANCRHKVRCDPIPITPCWGFYTLRVYALAKPWP